MAPNSDKFESLGFLELSVMEVIWSAGNCTVRDVMQELKRELAYTTVMTTLDRLFKKGLLNRTPVDRAFVYAARLSRHEWERQRAGALVGGFLQGPKPSRELLISCLIDACGEYDSLLLQELEARIRKRRKDFPAAASKQAGKITGSR